MEESRPISDPDSSSLTNESGDLPAAGLGAAADQPADVPATVVAGALVIRALPWAEVVSIVDQNGDTHPVGDLPYTPLHRSLPPGTYDIRLENPNVGAPVGVQLVVRAGEVVSHTVEFERLDAVSLLGDSW